MFRLLSRIGATATSQLAYLLPVVGIVTGALMLGEVDRCSNPGGYRPDPGRRGPRWAASSASGGSGAARHRAPRQRASRPPEPGGRTVEAEPAEGPIAPNAPPRGGSRRGPPIPPRRFCVVASRRPADSFEPDRAPGSREDDPRLAQRRDRCKRRESSTPAARAGKRRARGRPRPRRARARRISRRYRSPPRCRRSSGPPVPAAGARSPSRRPPMTAVAVRIVATTARIEP